MLVPMQCFLLCHRTSLTCLHCSATSSLRLRHKRGEGSEGGGGEEGMLYRYGLSHFTYGAFESTALTTFTIPVHFNGRELSVPVTPQWKVL